MPTFFTPRPSIIKPNLDFWFENIPSGNSGFDTYKMNETHSTNRYFLISPFLIPTRSVAYFFGQSLRAAFQERGKARPF
jgi:hypothetical protein